MKLKALFVLVIFILAGCAGTTSYTGPTGSGGKLYTAYNIWYENPLKLYDINYKKGAIIPIGTEVSNVEIGSHRRYRIITFKTVANDRSFRLYWNPRHHNGSTVEDFAKQMFTEKTFDELTSGLSANEIEAVKRGKIKDGMSRKAVVMSWGPPPEHLNYSLKQDQWIYQTSRFSKKTLEFHKGRIVQAQANRR